jgi:DNA-binding MarR family transcriptional regulator
LISRRPSACAAACSHPITFRYRLRPQSWYGYAQCNHLDQHCQVLDDTELSNNVPVDEPVDPQPVRMGETFEADWPGAGASATDCVMNVILAADLSVAAIAEVLRPFELTPAAAQVLSIVHGAREPLPHHVIADRMLVRRGTVTWLVDGLEKRGLVCRVPHPESRRTVLVEVTAAGTALLGRFRPLIHSVDCVLVADLTPAEQELLVDLLSRVQARGRQANASQSM